MEKLNRTNLKKEKEKTKTDIWLIFLLFFIYINFLCIFPIFSCFYDFVFSLKWDNNIVLGVILFVFWIYELVCEDIKIIDTVYNTLNIKDLSLGNSFGFGWKWSKKL